MLWSWTAEIRGRLAAHLDIARGHYELLRCGLPPPWRPEYARLLHERYDIEFRPVAGCIVSQSLVCSIFFGFIFLLALGRKIAALQRRTCSFHSPEKFLTLSLGLGSLVKDAISTELLSLDRSKIESMLKEIQSIRSKVPSKE